MEFQSENLPIYIYRETPKSKPLSNYQNIA